MLPSVVLYKTIPEDLHAHLEQHCDLVVVDSLRDVMHSDMRSILSTVEGIIGVNQAVGPELLDMAPKLRVISTISVGYDIFDVADLSRRSIMLMHTPDVLTETTADMIFMLILCTARRTTEMIELVRKGQWVGDIGSKYFGTDVHGKKLGILGMGRIGYAVAKRAHAGFNMEILYHSRSVNVQVEKDFMGRRYSLDQVLAESDFVCVTLPLSEQTNKLIGSRELALMKSDAFLINGGRGAIIDETALIESLQKNVIQGAGLDVYEQEPLPLDSPLLSMPNVVTLPHIGSATHETRHAMARVAVENLLAALTDRSPVRCVNPEVV